jgi:hypothetical protein
MINGIKYILNEIKVSECIYLYVTYTSEERDRERREEKIKIKSIYAFKVRSDKRDIVVN